MLSKNIYLEDLLKVQFEFKCHYTKYIFFTLFPDFTENELKGETRTNLGVLAYCYTLIDIIYKSIRLKHSRCNKYYVHMKKMLP